jgi:hypothetical protein
LTLLPIFLLPIALANADPVTIYPPSLNVKFTWTAATGEPEFYNIRFYDDGNETFITIEGTQNPAAPEYPFVAQNGHTYQLQVQAADHLGNTGAWSALSRAYTIIFDASTEPIAHWRFDETAGQTAYDVSGDENHGTVLGPTWTAGRVGGALEFDGVDDSVAFPDSPELNPNRITLMAWVKIYSFPAEYPRVISKDKGEKAYQLAAHRNGKPFFRVQVGDVWYGGDFDASLSLNAWYHLAGVYDGASLKAYINGVKDSKTYGVVGKIDADSSALGVGGRADTAEYPFHGLIDDVRIYNRPLSEEEILSIVQNSALSIDAAFTPDTWSAEWLLSGFEEETVRCILGNCPQSYTASDIDFSTITFNNIQLPLDSKIRSKGYPGFSEEPVLVVHISALSAVASLGTTTPGMYTVTISGAFTDGQAFAGQANVELTASLLAPLRPPPQAFSLGQNYPNTFNPETWIPYALSQDAQAIIQIYDVHGALIRRLDLGFQAAGYYDTRGRAAYWDGRNNLGEKVSSGVYFYVLQAGKFTATRKMVMRK